MRLNMKINNLNELNTPCLILDKNLLEKNCSKARKKCDELSTCLLYTSPSPRDKRQSRMPSSA